MQWIVGFVSQMMFARFMSTRQKKISGLLESNKKNRGYQVFCTRNKNADWAYLVKKICFFTDFLRIRVYIHKSTTDYTKYITKSNIKTNFEVILIPK